MKLNLFGRLKSTLAFSVLLFISGIITLPLMPRIFVDSTLDTSWLIALHHFFAKGLIFGKDIIFTFGPYGFLYSFIYFPLTYTMQLGYYSLLLFIFCFNLWQVFRTHHSRHSSLFLIAAFFFCGSLWFRLTDFFYLSTFIAAYYLGGKLSWFRSFLWGFAFALLSLVKFISFPIAIAILVLIGLDQLISRRRLPLIWIFYGLHLSVLWIFSGHPQESVIPYLKQSWEMATGYGTSMAKYGHPINILFISLFFTYSFFLFYLILRDMIKQSFSTALFHILTIGVFLYFSYRYAFIRADLFHVLSSIGIMLGLSALYFPLLNSFFECRKRIIAVMTFLFGTMALCTYFGSDQRPLELFKRLYRNAQFTMAPMDAKQALEKDYQGYKQTVREKYPLPKVRETIDSYPHDQAILIAHELNYKPRPIFQSHLAYTENFLQQNLDHLRSSQTSEYVLFRIDPIDKRYPSLDDSRSWPEMISSYEASKEFDHHILLKKSGNRIPFKVIPIREFMASYGDNIQVKNSDGSLVWIELEFQETPAYKFLTLLTAPVLPEVEISIAGKQNTQFFRLTPEITKSGFLLSPLVSFTGDFAAILESRNRHKLPPVSTFRVWRGFNLESLLSRAMFKPEFHVRIYSLEYDS